MEKVRIPTLEECLRYYSPDYNKSPLTPAEINEDVEIRSANIKRAIEEAKKLNRPLTLAEKMGYAANRKSTGYIVY